VDGLKRGHCKKLQESLCVISEREGHVGHWREILFFQAPKEAHIPFFNGMMAFAITPEKKNTLLAR
jgi:hypothetical protein